MSRRLVIQLIALVVVAVFAAGIWASGDELKAGWLRFYSIAVGVALALATAWDRWLWRLRPAQRIRGVPRDVSGTWAGTLTSLWIDPSTGEPPPPKPAFLVIRQTSSEVNAILLTDESKSVSTTAVVAGPDGSVSLDHMYRNRPDSRYEHRSRMHHGSASLDVSGRPATRLRGRYWTDRDSRGELDFPHRVKRPVDDYEEAVDLFGSN